MAVLYEVHTMHTKKMLRAFAKLYTEMGGRKRTFRFVILTIIFLTMPKALHAPRMGYIVCWGFAALVLILAFARSYITYFCLLLQDIYYKEEIPITMSFGHSKFEVKDKDENSFKYAWINKLYADSENLYFHMEDGDLFIIPKCDFAKGEPDDFYEFIQRATGKEFEAVNLSAKQKIAKTKFDMRQAEIDHDKKLMERKKKRNDLK